MRRGVLGEGPLVGVRFTLLGGKTHPNDSSELAFRIAGRDGFRQAIRSFPIGVLEPIVALEVSTRLTGAALAVLPGVTDVGPPIRALVPRASVAGLMDALASATGGDAELAWSFSHYDWRR